jgi:2,4-dienoyl-CoA reductase-like NADH-dependent reductase (Old Yellow Enzyme family)
VPHLFDEFKLRGVTLRNRIGVSPMCQYWSKDGMASDWHLVHLGSRAVGGAGLVIAEATAVEARGRITPQDLGIWTDNHIEPLARITQFIKEYGAVPGIQLAHAGRKASTAPPWLRTGHDTPVSNEEGGWDIVAPSPLAFRSSSRVPRELTRDDITEIQAAFRAATIRANEAGFEWLELHAAHGYLAHSFHSPLSNHRQDEYGGSFENRIRFTLETARIMRDVWPDDKPFTVRLSCSDWVDGGWTIEDSIELSRRLKSEGVDLIDCSSGFGVPGVKYPMEPGWQVPFSEAIRKEANIATAAVGMITEPKQADEIICNGQADIVLLGTQMLRDPYWAFHAAQSLHPNQAVVNLPSPYSYVLQP